MMKRLRADTRLSKYRLRRTEMFVVDPEDASQGLLMELPFDLHFGCKHHFICLRKRLEAEEVGFPTSEYHCLTDTLFSLRLTLLVNLSANYCSGSSLVSARTNGFLDILANFPF